MGMQYKEWENWAWILKEVILRKFIKESFPFQRIRKLWQLVGIPDAFAKLPEFLTIIF